MMRQHNARFTFITLIVFTYLFSIHCYADQYFSHHHQNNVLIITTDKGSLRLTALSSEVIEAYYQPDGVKQLPSFAIDPDRQFQSVKTTLENQPQQLMLSTDTLKVQIQKSPLRVAYFRDEKLVLAEEKGLFVQDTLRGFRFALTENEKLYGGGTRVTGMNRRGLRLPLYNRAHYGYETESEQMSYSLPAVISDKKYMLVFDNSATGNLDLGQSNPDVLQFEAVGGRTSYLFFSGTNYPNLIENYVKVTGKQPMPPRWALGNFASRFGYRSQQEVMDTVDKFFKQDFPLDAVVLDLYWFGDTIKGTMGNLEWDKRHFPEPEKMITELADKGVNTIVITEPFVLTQAKKWQDGVENHAFAEDFAGNPKTFDFYFGHTGLVDIFKPAAQRWFMQVYQDLADQGITAWWGDLGEPEVHPIDTLHTLADGRQVTSDEIHNVYGHTWTEQLYRTHRKALPNIRPLILMRSGFAGSQRFGLIPWTGDVNRTWGGLRPQIELSLQMSLFGLPYMHSDLGGFAGGETFDRELYIRWLQYGIFQPIYRPHAQDHIAPEPVFHDQLTQDILRPFIKLRYQMLPYNYTLAWQNSRSGMPLMRPLIFEDENNSSLFDTADSYLWGDHFFVQPIMEAGIETMPVQLPQGQWFDYWTGEAIQGGTIHNATTNLETIPVYVRAGAFVPMVDAVATTQDYSSEKLSLHYYADLSVPSAQGQMYEDDGISPNSYAEGKYELLAFKVEHKADALVIELDRSTGEEGYANMPQTRTVQLHIHNWLTQPKSVQLFKVDNKGQVSNKALTLSSEKNSLQWNGKDKLSFTVEWDHQPLRIKINSL